jgi:hypothetical protein
LSKKMQPAPLTKAYEVHRREIWLRQQSFNQ